MDQPLALAEVAAVIEAAAERQQNIMPRLRIEVETSQGRRALYTRLISGRPPNEISFAVWVWVYPDISATDEVRIVSVRGA